MTNPIVVTKHPLEVLESYQTGGRIGKSLLEWTSDKLLLGAGSGSDPTEIDGDNAFYGKVLVDTAANRPDAGTEGRWFIASDTLAISYDNGSSWVTVGTFGGQDVSDYSSHKSDYSNHKSNASAHHAKTGNYEVYANTEEVTSDPSADADHLGRIIRVRSGAGNKTYVKICVQNDADGYEWIQIGVST